MKTNVEKAKKHVIRILDAQPITREGLQKLAKSFEKATANPEDLEYIHKTRRIEMEQEIKHLKSKLSKKEELLKMYYKTTGEYEKLISSLENKALKLRHQWSLSEIRESKLEKKLADMKLSFDQVKGIADELREQLAKKDKELEEISKTKWFPEYNKKTTELWRKQRELSKVKKENESLKARVKELEKELKIESAASFDLSRELSKRS